MLDLHADIAAYRHRAPHGIDVGLHEARADLLVHRPRLGNQPRLVVDRVEGHVLGHRAGHVPRRNHADARKAKIDQAVLQIR